MRMKDGIFVGHHERTGTHIFLTPNGVQRGVGLHRLPEDRRWDADYLRTCKGLPWEVRPGRREVDQPTFGEEEQSRMAPIPVAVPPVQPTVRKMYVLKSDIERYGETQGCQGCAQIFLGGKTNVPHSEEDQVMERAKRRGEASTVFATSACARPSETACAHPHKNR